ncbi:uncharacterized protein STEHIDRAFT_125685 [Stereum hirsutum FP-91666 SS1]|uniref:uncharacterized protein n=1 Tax=Stereum hirsutum (strain FP-91666) TaxID=721885 RepID=UPI000444A005|nr:uncharacterized protein STEHIDRAFT_125685 [Stereum hirsutum FP-91666 SS1]EIM80645.1 hypothetical protein STEHIDRAFT_125685 [Stereum hirsutum FP-91666 SS1]
MLRTYAIWGRKRWVRIVLICVSILLYPPAIAVTQLELQSLIYISASYPGERGCFLSHASSIIYVAYILLGLSETTIFILTAVKARQHLRATHSPMVKMLYQQGIVYFFFILLATIANIIVPVTFAGETNWLATPQHVIHSLLCTRVLLFILRSRHSSNIRLASSSASRIQTATFTGKVTALFSTVWGPGDDSNDGLDGPGLMDDSSNDGDGSYGDSEIPDEGVSEGAHASRRSGLGLGIGGRRDEEHFELENLAPSPSPGYADGFSTPRTYEEPDSAKQLIWSNSVASSSRSRT